jgi:hypothetical protein
MAINYIVREPFTPTDRRLLPYPAPDGRQIAEMGTAEIRRMILGLGIGEPSMGLADLLGAYYDFCRKGGRWSEVWKHAEKACHC